MVMKMDTNNACTLGGNQLSECHAGGKRLSGKSAEFIVLSIFKYFYLMQGIAEMISYGYFDNDPKS